MRSTFLTVLCILTFIWNSYKLYNSFNAHQSASSFSQKMPEIMETVQDQMNSNNQMSEQDEAEAKKMLDGMMDAFTEGNIKTSSIINGISALLLIIGAALMWDLKKRGFWLYLAGCAVGIFAPMFIFGGAIGVGIGIFSAICALLFIGMYSTNLKILA